MHIVFRQLIVKKKKADHHHYHHHRVKFNKKKEAEIKTIYPRLLIVFINAPSTVIIEGKLRLRSSNFINFLFIAALYLISSILLSRVKLSQNYSINIQPIKQSKLVTQKEPEEEKEKKNDA